MSKQVDKVEFWKQRIDTAVKPHYTVYVTSEGDWKRINEEHSEIFKKEIREEDNVLDAGCGYGRWSELFKNYTGVDFSPDFIKMAKKNYPNKLFLEANLKTLPFKDKEFDVVFCVSIKKMIEDNLGSGEWQEMEKELKRVAKKVLIMEYEDPKPYDVI
jgi:ubiquinone/menaquinone biosynthesis C-methylase UbiE